MDRGAREPLAVSSAWQARRGLAWRGAAWRGVARRGVAWPAAGWDEPRGGSHLGERAGTHITRPEGQGAASGERTDVADRQIIERLDRIAGGLDQLRGLVEDLAILVAAGLTTKPAVRADSDLPLREDGVCGACGGTRVGIPEERGREAVRACQACGFAWRVFVAP